MVVVVVPIGSELISDLKAISGLGRSVTVTEKFPFGNHKLRSLAQRLFRQVATDCLSCLLI